VRLTTLIAIAGGMFMPPAFVAALAADTSALGARLALRPAGSIRVATYNASLNRDREGALRQDLATQDNPQARVIAEVIQRVRPDLLLVNEFDYDAQGESAALFQQNYLAQSQHGQTPITYAWRYTAPVNTGAATGMDLDHDGKSDGPEDAQGFGRFPGQYGMVVYSRFALGSAEVRSFQKFLWRDMPGNAIPPDFYPAAALPILRLSSKSHWDIPVQITARRVLHFLVSHPTPSAFDGPEDRNGRRNHDEIRLFADYITPGKAGYLVDDKGVHGGLAAGASFVIAGDLNADPLDGNSFDGAVHQLLDSPRVQAVPVPTSPGGKSASERQGLANLTQRSDPLQDTADFGDRAPGNLRADYVLPSKDIAICDSGVFWPTPEDPLFALVNDDVAKSSDHRLVWADLALDGRCRR
jgi:Endonuclease/Exonuclease/phosphatase family